MNTDMYHKYLLFMAGEAAGAMKDPSTDRMIRLSAEFKDFHAKSMASALPTALKEDLAGVNFSYSHADASRSVWMLVAGVLSLGVFAVIMYYTRRSGRAGMARNFKTALEAAAMRASLHRS
jgi:hypothetical protein